MRDVFIARRDYTLNDVFGEQLPLLGDNPSILENLSSLEKRTSPHETSNWSICKWWRVAASSGISSVTARAAIFSRPSLGTLPRPGPR